VRARTTRFNGAATHLQRNPNPILKSAASDGMSPPTPPPPPRPCRTSSASLDFISPVLDVFYTAAPAAVHLLKRRGAYSDPRVTQKGTHIDPNNGTRAGYLCVFLCIPNPNRVKAKERETGSRSTGHHRHRAWGKGAAPFDGARQK